MAKLFFLICLFLLAITIGCANSARILDESLFEPIETDEPDVAVTSPVVAPAATLPPGQVPATTVSTPVVDDTVDPPADVDETVTTPAANAATPATKTGGGGAVAGSGNVASANPDHTGLSFFMHDILGGSQPSGRVVTGVVANTDANGLPFSKPSNPVFPISGGVPLNTIDDIINNNNYPLLAGLNGSPDNTQLQNNDDNQAFVTAGQLPAGLTLQQLMFGSITVVDNELTEGHELGSSVIGKAQGFYLASSQDGSSHTLALTALFHSGEHEHGETEDTISFFGVHRTATPISHLAIIGGTGKYEYAKGHATIETELHHDNQHTTDGLETITHFTVYITP